MVFCFVGEVQCVLLSCDALERRVPMSLVALYCGEGSVSSVLCSVLGRAVCPSVL